MALLKLAALGAAGYFGYRLLNHRQPLAPAAFSPDERMGTNFAKVRDAGPDSMASAPRGWSRLDQALDESFPASDPPATY